MRFRIHGENGPEVIALHGGPAAVGEAAPIAQGLSDAFRVFEPWQRGNGEERLTVARHVSDLHELIMQQCSSPAPAIIGESWGAMLALAYAAVHPDVVGPIVLVGCGTFDPEARAKMHETLQSRTDEALRRKLKNLGEGDSVLFEQYRLTQPLFQFDPIAVEVDDSIPPFDVEAHKETWLDMVALQMSGVYPAAFSSIRSPVLMLHGDYDPHPGKLIRDSLQPHIPQLVYHEFERCGHQPWLEKHAREAFFDRVRQFLLEN